MTFLEVSRAVMDVRNELSSRKEATTKFVFFNILRVLSMLVLLLLITSTVAAMATNIKAVSNFEASGGFGHLDQLECPYITGSTVPNQPAGAFWSILNSLLIIFQSFVLLFSEIGWPMTFFDRYFPVLGSDFGLGPLGVFQALIAAQILSHHVDKLSVVAAFMLFAVSAVNMFLGIMRSLRAKELRSPSAYRARMKKINRGLVFSGAGGISVPVMVPTGKARGISAPVIVSPSATGHQTHYVDVEKTGTGGGDTGEHGRGLGFGERAQKAVGLRGFLLTKPGESLPRYTTLSPTPSLSRSGAAQQPPVRRDRKVEEQVTQQEQQHPGQGSVRTSVGSQNSGLEYTSWSGESPSTLGRSELGGGRVSPSSRNDSLLMRPPTPQPLSLRSASPGQASVSHYTGTEAGTDDEHSSLSRWSSSGGGDTANDDKREGGQRVRKLVVPKFKSSPIAI